MTTRAPRPPAGLQQGGRRLWRAVSTDYVLSEHETIVLREACRTVDALDGLQALVERDGLLSESSQGSRAHPALVELRQQRVVLARLVAALRVPLADDTGRSQRRGGPRGVYGLGSVS